MTQDGVMSKGRACMLVIITRIIECDFTVAVKELIALIVITVFTLNIRTP